MLQGKSRENKQKMDKRDSLNNCQCILRVICSTYYKSVSASLTTRKKCISWILIESVKQVKLVASWNFNDKSKARSLLYYYAWNEFSIMHSENNWILCVYYSAFIFVSLNHLLSFSCRMCTLSLSFFWCNKWRKLH